MPCLRPRLEKNSSASIIFVVVIMISVAGACNGKGIIGLKGLKKLLILHGGRLLFKNSFNQTPLKCTRGNKVVRILKEVHTGDCRYHHGDSRLFK